VADSVGKTENHFSSRKTVPDAGEGGLRNPEWEKKTRQVPYLSLPAHETGKEVSFSVRPDLADNSKIRRKKNGEEKHLKTIAPLSLTAIIATQEGMKVCAPIVPGLEKRQTKPGESLEGAGFDSDRGKTTLDR